MSADDLYAGLKWIKNAYREDLHNEGFVNKIVGKPRATDFYSSEQLVAMGFVGIYDFASSDTEATE